MTMYGHPTEWVEHFDPDDPLYDSEDDRPTDGGEDYLRLFDPTFTEDDGDDCLFEEDLPDDD